MEKENERIQREANRVNLELFLRILWGDRTIDEWTHWAFLRRVWGAKTKRELLKVARELAELLKAKEGENPCLGHCCAPVSNTKTPERPRAKRGLGFRSMVLALAISVPFLLGQVGCEREEGDNFYVGEKAQDPCDRPVPSLRENWGLMACGFEDQYGNSVILNAGAGNAWLEGFVYDDRGNTYRVWLDWLIVDCFNAVAWRGMIDWNGNGTEDSGEFLSSVKAKLEIYDERLRIYRIVLDGEPYQDIEAGFTGSWVEDPRNE